MELYQLDNNDWIKGLSHGQLKRQRHFVERDIMMAQSRVRALKEKEALIREQIKKFTELENRQKRQFKNPKSFNYKRK